MSRRLRALYPFCVVAFPLLSLVAHNADDCALGDVALVLAATLAGTAVVFAVASALARGNAERAAALTLLAVVWFVFYIPASGPAVQLLVKLGVSARRARSMLVPGAGLVATLGIGWWVLARRPRLEGATRFLAIGGATLVLLPLAQLALIGLRNWRDRQRSDLARELAAPVPAPPPRPGDPRPDIYLIVLDNYGNRDVLREFYGYDNRAFEDSLRRLGFVLPPVTRSNYTRTTLSLPSLLNFSHLLALERDLGPDSQDHALPYYLARVNRTARFLKSRGYRFYLFPSLDWPGTRSSPLADTVFRPGPGVSLARELRRTNLRKAWISVTLLRYLVDPDRGEAEFIRGTFEGLARVPQDPAPTFAFAHVVAPHPPYVLDPECRDLPRALGGEFGRRLRHGSTEDRAAYIDQVRCVNRLTLRLIGTLLAAPGDRPVILLQSDHGTGTTQFWLADPGHPRPEQVRERFGAFGAYYLPGPGAPLPDTVTVVNVMRYVLARYFGADLPRLPDDEYYSVPRPAYRFVRVSPAGADSAHRSAGQRAPARSPGPGGTSGGDGSPERRAMR